MKMFLITCSSSQRPRRWDDGEDVFREWIRTAMFLGDPASYFRATESARHFNALITLLLWAGPDLDSQIKLVDERFHNTTSTHLAAALGHDSLLLDYFVYEIVEDTICCGVLSPPEIKLFERRVAWLNGPATIKAWQAAGPCIIRHFNSILVELMGERLDRPINQDDTPEDDELDEARKKSRDWLVDQFCCSPDVARGVVDAAIGFTDAKDPLQAISDYSTYSADEQVLRDALRVIRQTDLLIFLRTYSQWKDRDDIPNNSYPGRLDDVLITPAEPALKTASRLVIVPFNYLHNIPLHALQSVHRLVEDSRLKEIVYLPDASLLVHLPQRRPKRRTALRCLFIGYAEAEDINIEDEWAVVAELFERPTRLTGSSATKDRVLAALPEYDLVHFACHGDIDDERACSYLKLSDGGLYPTDIGQLASFAPELVVINACVAGVSLLTHGRGNQIGGLHTTMLYCGCRQVIATMWSVSDRASVSFTQHFYKAWLEEPYRSTAAVLLDCQRRLRQESDDIFYWAAHALYGDWR
jgi:hypothetical protein